LVHLGLRWFSWAPCWAKGGRTMLGTWRVMPAFFAIRGHVLVHVEVRCGEYYESP
jgi:hypothetical protein